MQKVFSTALAALLALTGEAFAQSFSLVRAFHNLTPDSTEQFGNTVTAAGNNALIGSIRGDAPSTKDNIGLAYLLAVNVKAPVYLYSSDQNQPPIANAAADQIIEDTSPAGALVTLNGLGSFDPDHNPLTYTWRDNGIIIAGPTPRSISQVPLRDGSHKITLTVDDGRGAADNDETIVTIAAFSNCGCRNARNQLGEIVPSGMYFYQISTPQPIDLARQFLIDAGDIKKFPCEFHSVRQPSLRDHDRRERAGKDL